MELLYDVHGQQGPDLLLHDLICEAKHTGQMHPDTEWNICDFFSYYEKWNSMITYKPIQ